MQSQSVNYILTLMATVDWLEVVGSLASVATAGVAFAALRNWRRQDKAKRQSEFLDELVEATHTYVVEIQKPIDMLHMAKIGMAAHVESSGQGTDEDRAVSGAITYIQKRGEEHGKRLGALVGGVEPSMIRLQTLAAKGQVFGFANYNKCQGSVAILTLQQKRIVAFWSIIQSSAWYWDNPEVRASLVNVMAIDPEEMRSSIAENNVGLLAFVGETYRRIYG